MPCQVLHTSHMTKNGKDISEKTFKKVGDYLKQWLDTDERIIGMFRASRWNPPSEGFVLTNHRLLIVDKLIFKINKVVEEIAADDIREFTSEKGLVKARKSYVSKKDGTSVYLGSMYKGDALILSEFLSQMSGVPQPIAEKMRTAKTAKLEAKRQIKDDDIPQKAKLAKEKDSTIKSRDKTLMRNVGFVLFWPSFVAYRLKIGSELKNAKIREIQQQRESLHEDWKTIIATVAKSLKQHWNTLEVKFEQHIEEDDYGNQYIDSNIGSEIIYFSHKVVLPEIKKLIADGRIKHFSFETIPAPNSVMEDLYKIKFNDEATDIASKYVSGLLADGDPSNINDALLSALNKYDVLGEVSVKNESNDPSDKANLLTLNFEGTLQPNRSIKVTAVSGIVFILFYAMYNSRPEPGKSKHPSLQVDFIGNDPYKYEEYVKEILRNRGFQTRKTRSSGDFGVDVLASKNDKSYAIQCKLYNHAVGPKAIQEIVSGRLHYRTDYALVVSDNKFTEAAKSLARTTNVTLTHHKNLLRSIESLEASQNQTRAVSELKDEHLEEASQEPTTKNEWTKDDADELVTVILPTIRND